MTYRDLDEVCKKFYEEMKSEEEAQAQSSDEQEPVAEEPIEDRKD